MDRYWYEKHLAATYAKLDFEQYERGLAPRPIHEHLRYYEEKLVAALAEGFQSNIEHYSHYLDVFKRLLKEAGYAIPAGNH